MTSPPAVPSSGAVMDEIDGGVYDIRCIDAGDDWPPTATKNEKFAPTPGAITHSSCV